MLWFRSATAIVGLLLAVGCASSTEEDADPTGQPSGSFCTTSCARLHSCDESKDEKTCKNACDNDNAATLPKLRSDIVGAMSSCIDEADCKTVLAGTVVATCADEASASVAPSEAATSYCDARVKSAKKCGKTVSNATCLTTAKLYNDTALADATECTDKACADVEECVDAALGSLKATSGGSSSSETETETSDAGASAATTYCNALTAATQKCGTLETSTANCLAGTKNYSDAELSDAEACTTLACSLIDDCIADRLQL